MIRFACPTCKAVLKAPPRKAGEKVACLKWGQPLLIPNPVKPAEGNVNVPPPIRVQHRTTTSQAAVPNWLDDVAKVEGKPSPEADDSSVPVLELADESDPKASPDTRTLPSDWLDNVGKRVKNIRRRNGGSNSTVAILLMIGGGLLAGIGFLMLWYFWLIYDTSVPVYPYSYFSTERVHNIGLMQNRLVGIIIGGGALVVGLVLALVGLFFSLGRMGK